MYKKYYKRIFDFSISLILLVFFSPLILLTSVLLFITNRGQVFFLQKRPGYKSQLFIIYKFKTMNDNFNSDGVLLPDSERITRIGKIIRSFSIDELLQLINVLKGEMSLVGPRPLLVKYLKLYSNEQLRRHDVKPGITGLAQINGRNTLTWNEKFRLDLIYVDDVNFKDDIKIIFYTICRVLQRKGISAVNHSTMEEFNGYN